MERSTDFVFDEPASGRRVKTLTIVDDCGEEVEQIAADTPALWRRLATTRTTNDSKPRALDRSAKKIAGSAGPC